MSQKKQPWWLWLLPLPVVWWAAAVCASVYQPGQTLLTLLAAATTTPITTQTLEWTQHTPRMLAIFTMLYAVLTGVCATSARNTRRGAEHGSARWGSAQAIVRRYRAKQPQQNLLLTRNFRMSLDGHYHKRNLNVLVVGGSGAGKTRTYAVPNVMQCCCSMVITDPKAEILRKTGHLLKAQGYEVRVFDLISPGTSFCYNPFAYVQDDKDVLQLIENLIKNTTPPNSQSNDPFWTKSETALLQALMLYLLHEAPPEEQNLAMILDMIASADVKEDDDEHESPLDILFTRLAMRSPEDIAVKQYAIFKQAAGKTARSILISAGVRLAAFNLPQIAALTATDDLKLHELGEKKIALFCCIPDSDASLNYLVGMIYSQLIQVLYRIADRNYNGSLPAKMTAGISSQGDETAGALKSSTGAFAATRPGSLPVPVHLLMDEYANLSLPKESFLAALGTMRSRNIFCSIILQNLAQIKAMYKDGAWESLVGLCDSLLYLGGNEKETHKYVSELLGKETLDTNTYGHTKGRNGSYSTNFQQTARELLTPDEVRLIDNSKAVLFVRGERPMLDDKIDLLKHHAIKQTEDGGAPPYDYTAANHAHDDIVFDLDRLADYELLDVGDFI